MKKSEKKTFKVGNIILHKVSIGKDIYAQQPDGENRFVRKEVEEREETLLIVGYSDKSFIVTPLGSPIGVSPIGVGSRQARFTFGGFPNCFKLLSKYVNETCYSVSS
jgi:hypothetical protein